MKRKLTNTQMQESIAELTDDVTALKASMQEVHANQTSTERRFTEIFEVLDQAAKTIRQGARNQLRYEQEANERMTRIEATVQKLSDTVDRYLSARLNGNRQN
jgi:two-component sensor histidine kinase